MKNATNVHKHNKRSKTDVLRIEKDIRALRTQGKTHDEIMELLKIPIRSYRRYCSRIYSQDKEIWASIVHDEIEAQLLLLKTSLEYTYLKALELAKTKSDTEEIISALQTKDSARVSIIQLLSEGPEMIRKAEIQLPKNDTKPYVEKYEWRENAEQVLENEE
jgi:hypothetical protein